jgi:hypothetical protein
MSRKKLSEIRDEKRAQRASLKTQIALIEQNSAKHLGNLAASAGLSDLNLKEAQLLKEFAAIAARFCNEPEIPARQGPQAPQPGGPGREAA